jgi:predicted lipoprotein
MKKNYIYIILAVLFGTLIYNSVYFEKLSKRPTQKNSKFDFKTYADSLYYKGILKSTNSIEVNQLLALAKANPDSTFKAYGNRLGIGESAYFMVNAQGKIFKKDENSLKIASENGITLNMDTKFIFGNAIRDASGLVKLTDFKTNADFNKVSEELNAVIREKAIPENLNNINNGDLVSVTGAIKLKKGKSDTPEIQILPIKISKPL